MSDNLSFLLTCAAECLNNWGYDGHGKHVDDGVKEIAILRSRIESAEEAYVRLDASMNRLKGAFRVNMLRAFPNLSYEEIDAEINRVLENGDEVQS